METIRGPLLALKPYVAYMCSRVSEHIGKIEWLHNFDILKFTLINKNAN